MSVELRVIANKTNAEDIEITQFEAGITLDAHLRAIMPDYEPRPVPLFSALLNGDEFLPQDWAKTILKNGDVIICTAEPKEPTTIALVVIAVVSAAAAIYYANQNIPDNYNTTTPSGSSIYDANAQGNRPKLMGAVPELFGTHKVFPDYVVPPRKQFIDNDEYFFALMSITRGQVELSAQNIFIGNTPITSFGNDVWAQVFEPGADVSGHPAHKVVYVSPEIGAAGDLELLPSQYSEYWKNGTGSAADQYQLRIGYEDPLVTPPANATKVIDVRRWTGSGWSEAHVEQVSAGEYMEYWATGPEIKSGIWRGNTRYDPETLQPIITETFDNIPWDTMVDALIRRFEGDGAGGYIGPFYAAPTGMGVDRFRVLIRFPHGLCVLDNGGTPQTRSVTIGILWKDKNAGADDWQRIIKTYTDSTLDELVFTEEITCPQGTEPVVMLANYTQGVDDIKYKDTVHWYRLESDLSSPTAYPDCTTLAVRIKGTNALASTAENKISCVPTRKLRHFDNNGNLTFGPTNDLSAAILHTWTDAGNADDSIDMDELWRLHQIWKARGDEFHAVFDNETTVWDAIKRQMAVGFTEPTLEFGQLVPVRDEPQPNINYMYQPDNIIPKSFKMSATMFDESEPDGVEVEYMSNETWKPETILCTLPGEYGLKPEKVRAFGVTSRDKAYQFGMRKRCALRYRRISYEFSTEMDGLNSRYLSPDAVGIDMMGFSQTGRVESVSGRTLTLNADLQWENGTHYIGLRKPDGSMSGPYVCAQGAQSDQVVLASDLDFVPRIDGTQEPPLFMFGSADRMCERVLIQEIDPQGTERVKLKAVNYDERVFDYDDAPAPS